MGTNTTTLGEHQEIHVGQFKTDRRGLITGSIQRHRDEARNEINTALLLLSAAPTGIIALGCTGVDRTWDAQSKKGIYTYSFEGLTDEPSDNDVTFELDVTMEEVGIEAHPNLAAIEKKFGTFDTQRKRFPKLGPNTDTGEATALSKARSSKETPNPLYGTDSYYVFGMTFKKSYARKQIPPGVLAGIGTIIDRPPGIGAFPLPPAAKYRQWLKIAPKITLRGNCVQIEENFVMSGRHGIVKEIYGSAQLGEAAYEQGT